MSTNEAANDVAAMGSRARPRRKEMPGIIAWAATARVGRPAEKPAPLTCHCPKPRAKR